VSNAARSEQEAAYVLDRDGGLIGQCSGSVTASYMHVHFATLPTIAPRFVAAAGDWARLGRDPR